MRLDQGGLYLDGHGDGRALEEEGRRRPGAQPLQECRPPPEWDLQQGFPEYHDKYQARGIGYIQPSLSGKGGW